MLAEANDGSDQSIRTVKQGANLQKLPFSALGKFCERHNTMLMRTAAACVTAGPPKRPRVVRPQDSAAPATYITNYASSRTMHRGTAYV